MNFDNIRLKPNEVFDEYKKGAEYKASIGEHGINEQSKINERFYAGDQWHGIRFKDKKPLASRNIIKRIADYKLSSVGSAPVAVNYSADGVPNTADLKEEAQAVKDQMFAGEQMQGTATAAEVSVITSAMSDYFRVTAERVKFESKKDLLLKNAYISGTAIAYTYWDSDIETGLYADEGRTQAIKGDIDLEVLDVENVVFGDPNSDNVQGQPYILISQRKDVAAVKREAQRYNKRDIEQIKPDNAYGEYSAGERGENEFTDSHRVTVITKLFKEYDDEGKSYKIYAIKVCENAVVRPKWELKLKLYPIAVFHWDKRRSCAYGDSEITNKIQNQIAINRSLTAEVWAMLLLGMPKLLVNGDVIQDNITNDPAQIVKVYGSSENIENALRYVSPAGFGAQMINSTNDLASNTLTDAGANEAALGDIKPDNATAIIQVREASTQAMQMYRNRFYDFIEDIARIWADFWINFYGKRSLKIKDKTGTQYLPFDAERYKSLLFTAKIDVGADTLWSTSVVVATLNNLLSGGYINVDQYLERIPDGMIPDVTGLREDIKAQAQAQAQMQSQMAGSDTMAMLAEMHPDVYAELQSLSPEEQQQALSRIGMGGTPTQEEVGDI